MKARYGVDSSLAQPGAENGGAFWGQGHRDGVLFPKLELLEQREHTGRVRGHIQWLQPGYKPIAEGLSRFTVGVVGGQVSGLLHKLGDKLHHQCLKRLRGRVVHHHSFASSTAVKDNVTRHGLYNLSILHTAASEI